MVFPAGAIAAGVAIRRPGSARAAVLGTMLTRAGILAAGLADSVAHQAGALSPAGATDVTAVAQNVHGLRVQRCYGRSASIPSVRSGPSAPPPEDP